jgi:hypothetical protein
VIFSNFGKRLRQKMSHHYFFQNLILTKFRSQWQLLQKNIMM